MLSKFKNSPSLRWRFAQWLERRWWRNYLKHKSATTYLADKRAYWQKVLDQFDFVPTKNAAVLDAGCGPAGIYILLHEKQRMTALDPLLDQYATDLEIFDRSKYPGVTFITAPLEKPIGVNESPASTLVIPFKTIYCFNAVNHVNNWDLAMDRLTEWAGPDSTMLLSSDVHRRPWLNFIFNLLPGDVLHPQQHDRNDYRNALENRGWTIEKEVLLRREWIFDYVGWKVVRSRLVNKNDNS